MHDYGPFSRKNVIDCELPIQEKGEAVEIDCITLDDFLKKGSIPKKFELMVIDVENGELNVLKSFSSLGKKYCPTAIIIETENGNEVQKFMNESGYTRYCSLTTDCPTTTNDIFVSSTRMHSIKIRKKLNLWITNFLRFLR